MYQLKTQLNDASVLEFLKASCEGQKLEDCYQILDLMKKLSGKEPKMWGKAIIGFGKYHYKYASGMEGDWMVLGFSPRKANITLYIMPGFGDYDDKDSNQSEIMGSLGKFKTGKSCLYIKKIADINLEILTKLIQKSLSYMKQKYQTDL